MKKKQYGRTNLWVSEVCLGTGRIGWLSERTSAYSVLDTYLEEGGNFIQATTRAGVPSRECDPQRAESLLGDWLKANASFREHLVISARIRCPQNLKGLELEESVRGQIEQVLKRVGIRYIDIVLLDWSNGFFPTYEVMSVLERFADAGLIRHAGSIGFPCWRIAEWLGRGAQPSRMRLESAHLEGPFTSCCLEELAREHRVSLVARWPFGDGYEPLLNTAKVVFGKTSFQVGMSWLLSKSSICSVQFSPKLKSQLLLAIEAARIELRDSDLAKVEEAYLQCALPPFCPRSEEFVFEGRDRLHVRAPS